MTRTIEFRERSSVSRKTRGYSTIWPKEGLNRGLVCARGQSFSSVTAIWTIGSSVMFFTFRLLKSVAGFVTVSLVAYLYWYGNRVTDEVKLSFGLAFLFLISLRGRGTGYIVDSGAMIVYTAWLRYSHFALLSGVVRSYSNQKFAFIGSTAIECVGWILAYAAQYRADSLTFYLSALGIVALAAAVISAVVLSIAMKSDVIDSSFAHRLPIYTRIESTVCLFIAGSRACEAWFAPARLFVVFESLAVAAEFFHVILLLLCHTPVSVALYESVDEAKGGESLFSNDSDSS